MLDMVTALDQEVGELGASLKSTIFWLCHPKQVIVCSYHQSLHLLNEDREKSLADRVETINMRVYCLSGSKLTKHITWPKILCNSKRERAEAEKLGK